MMIPATENDGAEMLETEIGGCGRWGEGEHEQSGPVSEFHYIFLVAR